MRTYGLELVAAIALAVFVAWSQWQDPNFVPRLWRGAVANMETPAKHDRCFTRLPGDYAPECSNQR